MTTARENSHAVDTHFSSPGDSLGNEGPSRRLFHGSDDDDKIAYRVDEARAFAVLIVAIATGATYWVGYWFVLYSMGVAFLCYLSSIPLKNDRSFESSGTWSQLFASRKAVLLFMYVVVWTCLFRAVHILCVSSDTDTGVENLVKGRTHLQASDPKPRAAFEESLQLQEARHTKAMGALQERLRQVEESLAVAQKHAKEVEIVANDEKEAAARKLRDASQERAELQSQIAEKEQKHARERNILRERIANSEGNHTKAIERLSADLLAVRAEKDDLSALLDSTKEEVVAAKLKGDEAVKTVEEAQAKAMRKLREEIQSKAAQVEAFSSSNAGKQSECNALKECCEQQQKTNDELRAQHSNDMEHFREDKERLSAELSNRRNEMKEIAHSHQSEVEQFQEQHANDLAIRKKMEERLSVFSKEIESLHQQLEKSEELAVKAKAEHESALRNLRQELERASSALLNKKLRALQEEHIAAMAQSEQEAEDIITEHQYALQTLREELVLAGASAADEKVRALEDKHRSLVSEMEKEKEQLQAEHQSAIQKMKDKLESAGAFLSELEKEHDLIVTHKGEQTEKVKADHTMNPEDCAEKQTMKAWRLVRKRMRMTVSRMRPSRSRDEYWSEDSGLCTNPKTGTSQKKRHWDQLMTDALIEDWNSNGIH